MAMQNPHAGQPIYGVGKPLEEATSAMILLHGRGASSQSMLVLADKLAHPMMSYIAPQAADYSWWPHRFIAPVVQNEPWLTSALIAVDMVVERVTQVGIPEERIILLGFSQGAVLAGEYAARHPKRYGGVVMFSGGLFGPDDEMYPYEGDMAGTPVFIGCSDVDFHIPIQRLHDSAAIFKRLGADVTERIYSGMGHEVNEDELAFARALIAKVAG